MKRSSFYGKLSAVLREDRVFFASIAENVSLGARRPDLSWVEQCCRDVDLHDEIVRLPEGYDTVIKDDGAVLSAGQRQRLLLARAFYRRPALLFLDEATSNLDPQREWSIVECLREMPATRIIVTHREAPLSIADRVYEFRDGTLSERPLPR